jgi:hypothetical protein
MLSSPAYISSHEKRIVCVNDTVSIDFTIDSFSVDVINS